MSTKLKWLSRIIALVLIVFGLPFYFGYGNPLPFINPSYSAFDNLWLTIFPLMFIGLGLGWKYEKLAGWWLVTLLGGGLLVSVYLSGGFPVVMIFPFIIGVLYLIISYKIIK